MERKNNVATIKEAHQNFNNNNLEAAVKDVADRITYHDHGRGLTAKRSEEFLEMLKSWKSAFSDAHIADVNYIEAGDNRVIAMARGRGTNDGSFADFDPTGKQVDVPMCEVVQFNNEGQLIGGELYFDRMTLMEQLGHLEEMAKQH